MTNTYDAIVVGGGHNGLVSAAYTAHRTPVDALSYASWATHAGGGVCGIPGMQAARAARRWPRRLLARAR